MSKPLAIDLFCGKGGWSHGLLAAGWSVIGVDIADMGGYPAQLVLQDVATIDGTRWRGKVQLIVASPPCQEFSYMAMPWKRAKQIAAALRGEDYPFPHGYRGSRTIPELNALFQHCFRIAGEAQCPLVVENVKGAQPWVGAAKANYGSFYLWGDVEVVNGAVAVAGYRHALRAARSRKRRDKQYALLDVSGGTDAALKVPGFNFHEHEKTGLPGRSFQSAAVADGVKVPTTGDGRRTDVGKGARFTSRDCGVEGVKQAGLSGRAWFDQGAASVSSNSAARKEASARIAMIPFPLAEYIGRAFHPDRERLKIGA